MLTGMQQPPVFNYVVGFYDLLGQRNALRGKGLLHPFASPADEQTFVASVKASIGAIINLQRRAEDILAGALRHCRDSPLRMALPKCVFRPIVTDDFGIVTAHFG